MQILITGGTGLVGSHLILRLLELNHIITVVTRHPEKARKQFGSRVLIWQNLNAPQTLDGFDAVINLAGAPIAEKRWTVERKQLLCQSRWQITQRLTEMFKTATQPPAVFISGSAIGYYGNRGDAILTEEENARDEFTHQLCARWEQIACQAQSDHTRVCLLRTGVVFAAKGGMLAKILPLFRAGLGGPMGDGKQYLSWIHIVDMVNGILWLLAHPLRGPFNMVSPYSIQNEQFTHALGDTLHRPVLIRVPAGVIRLLMGESAVLVLGSQRAQPKQLEDSGFSFRYFDVAKALTNIVKNEKPR